MAVAATDRGADPQPPAGRLTPPPPTPPHARLGLGGWLLTPFLAQAGAETVERMRARVRDNLTGLFASHYKARLSLRDALTRDAALAYNARRTGEKYLIVQN